MTNLIRDRVRCAVPTPGAVAVGSTITLGSAPSGYRSFLAAFGAGAAAYFVLSDGAGRAITGTWTVNGTTPETATITAILANDRLGGTAGETFIGPCIAYSFIPAARGADTVDVAGRLPMVGTSPGVGQLVPLNSGSGSALAAPAGGTWFAWWIGVTVSTGVVTGVPEVAEVPGGTQLKAGTSGVAFYGWAIRKS